MRTETFRVDDKVGSIASRGYAMAEFVIRPHGRLHDWIADERGCATFAPARTKCINRAADIFETVGSSEYETAVITG